jgi:hypothetical protein
MNLYRHLSVLWRGRVIIALGLIVAIAMAILAMFKVSIDGGPKLTYRKAETWAHSTKLLITQPGFPWGRSVLPSTGDAQTPGSTEQVAPAVDAKGRKVQFADPSRFAYLAWIYSHFLMGDQVRQMLPHRPVGMDILASPLTAGGNLSAGALPLIGLTTQATTERDAARLNDEATAALETYLREQQTRSRTPTSDRVVVTVVDRPAPALLKGHSPDLGVIAFLLVMGAVVAVVYLRENLRLHRAQVAAGLVEPVMGSLTPVEMPHEDPESQERIVGFDGEPLYGGPRGRERTTVR